MANYQTATLATNSFAPSDLASAPATPASRKSAPDVARHDAARREALPSARAPYRQSLLSRLISMLVVARQRETEREIARYVETTGGKLTDSVEREILRRLM